ncbi:MAG: DUF421 domain-containing protein [Clostridia bacterium]|nr:DUF421 domain-containing protein [Clostridia bacterium]
MAVTLIRGLILYLTIIICMRFMGKRQIGELQPTELVITILISQIVSIPMENNDTPMINSLFAVLMLVCLEIVNSVVVMKSSFLRYKIQGKPAIVIRNGTLDQKKLKDLRLTADDLFDQLRQKDVFDINQVQYAIFETNGTLSVMKKAQFGTPTARDMGVKVKPEDLQQLVMADGKYIKCLIKETNLDLNDIEKVLKKENVSPKEILALLIDSGGKYTLIKKEKK